MIDLNKCVIIKEKNTKIFKLIYSIIDNHLIDESNIDVIFTKDVFETYKHKPNQRGNKHV